MTAASRKLALGAALGACLVAFSSLPAAEDFGATTHRRFDDVEQWRKVFDDPARDEWQNPAGVVAALGLGSGMTAADLGAGTGYFASRLAAAVGPSGTVFAVEVEPNLVAHLRERAEKEGMANLIPVLASHDNPRLPAASIDLVLIVDTFHHIDARLEYLRRLQSVLRPGGRVAIIDWKKESTPVGPGLGHRIGREQVVEEMTTAGYRLSGENDMLPYQYFLFFRPGN